MPHSKEPRGRGSGTWYLLCPLRARPPRVGSFGVRQFHCRLAHRLDPCYHLLRIMTADRTSWHHAPLHIFVPNTVYMVTSGTLHKQHFYAGSGRLALLQSVLMSVMETRGWNPCAWALFSNHYHVIAKSPEENGDVHRLIQHVHSDAAAELNKLDGTPGRRVWYEYWDKCLTFEKSYYPRLNYVMNNPARHGLVSVANQYPFCSAGWFESRVSSAFARKVASFKYDRLQEPDDFQPLRVDHAPQ